MINSGTYSLEPVYADLWCVARAADPGRGGYCDNTSYNQNRKEFIFTVQFSYQQPNNDADGTPQYNYLHLVYGSQYDNGNTGVGIARDLNNGRPFRRLKPTQYELVAVVDPLRRHAGRERHPRYALRRLLPDGLVRDGRRPEEPGRRLPDDADAGQHARRSSSPARATRS